MKIGKVIFLGLIAQIMTSMAFAADPVMEVPYKLNGYGALPSDKVIIDAIPDPVVKGVVCWFSRAKLGAIKGTIGIADDPTELGISCRVIGPVDLKGLGHHKLKSNQVIFKETRNWNGIKTVQIMRTCDPKNATLIYVVYSDYLIDGSPKHAMDVVPLSGYQGTCEVVK